RRACAVRMPLQSGSGRGASARAGGGGGSRRTPGAGGRDGDLRVLPPPVPLRLSGRGCAGRRGSISGWINSDPLSHVFSYIASLDRLLYEGCRVGRILKELYSS